MYLRCRLLRSSVCPFRSSVCLELLLLLLHRRPSLSSLDRSTLPLAAWPRALLTRAVWTLRTEV